MLPAMIIIGALVGLAMATGGTGPGLLGSGPLAGALLGGTIGGLWGKLLELSARLDAVEKRTSADATRTRSVPLSPAVTEAEPEAPAARAAAIDPSAAKTPPSTSLAEPPPSTSRQPPEPVPEPTAEAAAGDVEPSPAMTTEVQDRPTESTAAGWSARLLGGNLPVKIGVAFSLIGIAALLRHAVEQGWLQIPIEARLALVALAALAALVFAWQQREQRRAFALSLQGGALGTLLLTVFAGHRLYAVIPAPLSFGLSGFLIIGTGVLAAYQNAFWLALFGMLAGFAAPLVLGEGDAGPGGLFAWYALLNLGLFYLAWARNWPLLNRLGFGFTFVIASLWGVLAWSPAYRETAQLYLMLFFLLYFLIPIFDARRHRGENGVDPVLVFGLPLLALPLQAAIFGGDRVELAVVVFAAALLYLASATWLIRGQDCRKLGQAHAVLAIALATLAVPLAFQGHTVILIWALQGAALVWYGSLQSSRLARFAGVLLQTAAGTFWLVLLGLSSLASSWLVIRPDFLGGLALTGAGLLSARAYERAGADIVRVGFFCTWALLFWSLNGAHELVRLTEGGLTGASLVAFWALSAGLAAALYAHKNWPVAGFAAGISMLLAALMIPEQQLHGAPLANWGAAAWAAVLVAALFADRCLRDGPWRGWHALAAHAALLAAASTSLVHLAAEYLALGNAWAWMLGSVPVLLLLGWLLVRSDAPLCRRPVKDTDRDLLLLISLLSIITGLLISLAESGSSDPLPWLPLLNPLELTQCVAVLALVLATRAGRPRHLVLPAAAIATLAWLVVTVMALRASHQLFDLPWRLGSLLDDGRAQAALSIVWTIMGTLAWVLGSRRQQYALWLGGAMLLGLVLLKLLVVDRVYLSTVAGILSFLAFGLLSIGIGFLAPAPPRRSPEHETAETEP